MAPLGKARRRRFLQHLLDGHEIFRRIGSSETNYRSPVSSLSLVFSPPESRSLCRVLCWFFRYSCTFIDSEDNSAFETFAWYRFPRIGLHKVHHSLSIHRKTFVAVFQHIREFATRFDCEFVPGITNKLDKANCHPPLTKRSVLRQIPHPGLSLMEMVFDDDENRSFFAYTSSAPFPS